MQCISTKIEDGQHFIPFDQNFCTSKRDMKKTGKRVLFIVLKVLSNKKIKKYIDILSLFKPANFCFLGLDAIKKRRHEISEILYKPADDARDEDEREPGNDSMVHGDDREPDVQQGVDHSDDEGNSKSRREVVFKGGRRKVILTSKRRRSESKDDEIRETNEEGNSRKAGKVKDDEGNVEGNEGNEMEMKSEEVGEEKVDRKVETEEKQEEREGDVEMSEVNERKVKDEEKEVEGKEMEETKVETQEMPEDQRTQEEVTGGIGVNRESEGEPTKDGDNSAVTAEEVEDAPAGSEKVVKSMDLVEQTADVQETKNQPKEGGEENETESKMQVDPGQENDE